MSKGREKYQARLNELSLLGKDLARRSGRKCELCDASGVALSPFEVAPVPLTPNIDHCAFLCQTCIEQLNSPNLRDNNHWRLLTSTVWSSTPVIQALSVAMLATLNTDWAIDLKEMLFLEPDIQDWSNKILEEI